MLLLKCQWSKFRDLKDSSEEKWSGLSTNKAVNLRSKTLFSDCFTAVTLKSTKTILTARFCVNSAEALNAVSVIQPHTQLV